MDRFIFKRLGVREDKFQSSKIYLWAFLWFFFVVGNMIKILIQKGTHIKVVTPWNNLLHAVMVFKWIWVNEFINNKLRGI